ncbi:HNH endonuclease [Psychroserpens sp. Hel_I_66]|uniref:HNH endonuclease n=1 Tax=Psychroserpens sp. Hel_I_66 TaxID=1250004 RepID=UPI000691C3DD|nr:HNH endonuclease [Psychroserpens sp. Hel_I_66]
MEKRSKEFLEVGFYLSKFGEVDKNANYPSPPLRFKVDKWNNAYRIFYEKLNGGRTILAFERSLKNTRDGFDSHLPNSQRIGWLGDNKKPSPLGKEAHSVFDNLIDKAEEQVWEIIEKYSDLNAKDYKHTFDDLIGIQESESEYKTGNTEGGKKVVTSSKYERQPSIRNEAINIHGLECAACGFNFQEFYGDWGKGFIEVHHIKPLSENKGEEKITNPETDLEVLCANCHRMVHRKKGITLSLQELKEKIIKNK